MPKYSYGRARDSKTHENLELYPHVPKHENLSSVTQVDLTSKMPPVFDQGQLGSCTANALLGAYEFEMLKQKEALVPLSRLFLYYQERAKEGTTHTDSGAAIEDGVWVLQKGTGVCQESIWPYNIQKFAVAPPATAVANAKNHHVVNATRLTGALNDLKQTLMNGNPIVFGIEVYSSFESPAADQTGVIPMPNTATEQLEGGHAIVLVGYDDTKQLFKFRNSWGTGWGAHGYGYLPYAYVTNPELASDFWVITLVKDTSSPTPATGTSTGTYTSSAPLPSGLTLNFQ